MNYLGIDLELTGLWLQKLCRQKSLTIRDIQQYLGLVYPQSIYRWFRGMALPSLDHLYLLSGLLKRDMDELLIGNRAWKGRRLCCYYLLICQREQQIKSRTATGKPKQSQVVSPELLCFNSPHWTSSPMTEAPICDMIVAEPIQKEEMGLKLQDREKGGAVQGEHVQKDQESQIYQRRG